MEIRPQPIEMVSATVEEIAEWLSVIEGCDVSIQEVRRIEAQALRKLRKVMQDRCLQLDDMLPLR